MPKAVKSGLRPISYEIAREFQYAFIDLFVDDSDECSNYCTVSNHTFRDGRRGCDVWGELYGIGFYMLDMDNLSGPLGILRKKLKEKYPD